MRRFLLLAALLAAVPAGAVTLDWIYVGNPGNTADTASNCIDAPVDCGSVPYEYRISKYEVTNAQYAEFLNAVAKADLYPGFDTLYGNEMATNPNGGIIRSGSSGSYTYAVKPGHENNPVVYVSLGDALRFVNWLQNGQPVAPQGPATTEDGSYTLPGPSTVGGRNPDAGIVLPTENEWYKAAYYDPTSAAYFTYPTGSNTAPLSTVPPGGENAANYKDLVTGYALTGSKILDGTFNYLTDVGAYADSASPYGTFDQGGSVWEMTETQVIRGGTWALDASFLASSGYLSWTTVIVQSGLVGFRVASLVPECSDGLDNDGDGLIDLADPGCADLSDLDEHSPTLPCDDGADNDGDGLVDYRAAGGGDPPCASPTSPREKTECQDGINNDYGAGIDFDGGASLNGGVPLSTPDPQCVGRPWRNSEAIGPACGLGFEIALIAPLLARLMRRRTRA
jgi:formylglycine-generating enzyme required for sulfatase activity